MDKMGNSTNEFLYDDLGASRLKISGKKGPPKEEMTLEKIKADNADRFRRAVEAYKKYAFVKSKDDLLEENLFENTINRVSRDLLLAQIN